MITEEILNIIYSKNINGETITTKELTDYGLNSTDIEKLVSDGVLQRIDSDTYGLTSFESLYNFGVYLINKEDYSNAYNIFTKCHELNPNHLETCEYLFFLSIKRNLNGESYEYLKKINALNCSTQNNINNIYLYLLTYKMQSANKSQSKKLKSMKLKELSLSTKEASDKSEEIVSDLNDALEVIGNVEENGNLSPSQKLVIGHLITQCIEKEKQLHNRVVKMAKNEEYYKIVSTLQTRDNHINLSENYKNILILSRKIVKILQTGEIPVIYDYLNSNSISITPAILHNNFQRALELKKIQMTGDNTEDIEYILLVKINELMKSTIYEQKISNPFSENDDDITNIIISLFQNNIETAIFYIKQYLKEIGKEEYQALIIDLIKISIQEKDQTYSKPISTLTELSKDEYVYNISFYLQCFYSSIHENKLTIAKLYLNIIKNYSQELAEIIISLEIDLMSAEKRYENQINEIQEYLYNKIKEMKENKELVLILEAMPHSRRKMIYQEVRKIPELMAFGIGSEPKRLVLRLLNTKSHQQSFKTHTIIIKNYKDAYKQKNYKECIRIASNLLEDPSYGGYNQTVYAYLGLSYYCLRNKQEAIKYLTIAQELSKEDKLATLGTYDFEEMIAKIRLSQTKTIITPAEERKIYVRIKESEFDDYSDDFYGISDIQEIAYYIQVEKMPLETACKKFNLTEEQIQLVKLIYARDYYIESMYPQGDKLLQEVEKSKNKTKKVRDLLNEIRASKRFYKNRPNAHTRKRIIQVTNN